MPSIKVAHIREQGQDMLLFPLDNSFGNKPESEQLEVLEELEWRAHSAGLAGGAVIFWREGGRERFMGPRPWHPFLKGLSVNDVLRSINQEITWSD